MKILKFKKLKAILLASMLSFSMALAGCSDSTESNNSANNNIEIENSNTTSNKSESESNAHNDESSSEKNDSISDSKTPSSTTTATHSNNEENIFEGYKLIEVDGGDLSGHREPNVVVDIGFGDREYWAFTNEHSQLVKVIAKEVILQDDSKEPVTSSGRYYRDEAKVPGVESKNLDEGHVLADSLGGVSNAYNITPQNSTLNRHGDQAYMEENIRKAGGCTDFVAIITYPNTKTQIPSHYSYTYTLKGKVINDEFDNINPDEYNANLESNKSTSSSSNTSSKGNSTNSNSNTSTSSKPNTTVDSTPVNNSGGGTVYWTPNGKSYHTTKGCSTLSRSKTILSGTQAESGKSDPCDRCH